MSLLSTPTFADAVGSPGHATLHPHWWTRLIDWVAEARSHRVLCIVAGIWLLNGFDLAFTILAYQQGLLDEQNPVARHVLEQGELPVMLYKVGLVLIGSYPLLRFRTARIAELGAIVVLVTYAFLAFRWSLCVELYSLTASGHMSLAEIETVRPILLD